MQKMSAPGGGRCWRRRGEGGARGAKLIDPLFGWVSTGARVTCVDAGGSVVVVAMVVRGGGAMVAAALAVGAGCMGGGGGGRSSAEVEAAMPARGGEVGQWGGGDFLKVTGAP